MFYARVYGADGPVHWCVDVVRTETREDIGRIEVGPYVVTAEDEARHLSFDAPGVVFGRYGRYDLHLVLNGESVAMTPLWLRPQ